MAQRSATQRSRGIWRILESPPVYRWLQRALGGERFRAAVVQEHARVQDADRVLDLGCGPGNVLLHLPAGAGYVGFDPSARYLEAARRRFGDRGRFVEASVGTFRPEDAGDPTVAIGVGILHHLDDPDVLALLDLVRAVLPPGGRFVAADPTVVEGQHPIARLLVTNDRGRHVRSPEATAALVRTRFPVAEVVVRHDLLRPPYTYAIVEAVA